MHAICVLRRQHPWAAPPAARVLPQGEEGGCDHELRTTAAGDAAPVRATSRVECRDPDLRRIARSVRRRVLVDARHFAIQRSSCQQR